VTINGDTATIDRIDGARQTVSLGAAERGFERTITDYNATQPASAQVRLQLEQDSQAPNVVSTVVLSVIPLLLIGGLIVGLTAGFFGGFVDTILSRASDVLLAVPQILIAVGVVAACSTNKNGCLGGLLQPGLTVVIAVITIFSWSYIARIVRGYTLSLREKEFVESARAAGAGNVRILATEIFPNLVGPLIVYSTLLIPTNILFEAALSYLRPRRACRSGIVGLDPRATPRSSTTSPGG